MSPRQSSTRSSSTSFRSPKIWLHTTASTPSRPIENVSLVNHDFRHVVLGTFVLHTVIIDGRANAAQEALSGLREDSFHHIKHVIFLGLNPAVRSASAIPQRARFIERCANLVSLKDETRELGYMMDVTLAPTVERLYVHLKKGDAPAKPIKAGPALVQLIITADLAHLESPANTEVSVYPSKVLALCRNIVRLDYLSLQLPGLQAHPYLPIPMGEKVADVLPPTLKSIFHLNIQLPYCTVEQGSKREAFAGGYLGWLLTTKPKIEQLAFNMSWRTWYLGKLPADRSERPRAVLEAMNLGALKYDETRQPQTYRPGNDLSTLNGGNMQFACMLFDAQPDLKTVTFRFDVVPAAQRLDTPATWLRTVTFTRRAGETSERGQVDYHDQIAFESSTPSSRRR